ncbi:sugar transferase [Azospirillum sp. ST 5-10]|uniref:sugar transferase n=1 Tax=Azospirillum sp. ST 5-10 TaxID=3445776 RepID=UPI003F4A22AF
MIHDAAQRDHGRVLAPPAPPLARADAAPGGRAIADAFKRTVDIFFSLICLFIVFPLLVLAVYLIWLDGGAPLFKQERIGRNGRRFACYKLRTMTRDADRVLAEHLARSPEAAAEWATKRKLSNDPRITPLGRFLRRSSVDELPQLVNVLRGDMSLVGPRPISEAEIPRYGDDFACYTAVRPGITGLWQVSGRSRTSYAQRVALDRHYAHNRSWRLDLVIMVRTVRVVLTADGAC